MKTEDKFCLTVQGPNGRKETRKEKFILKSTRFQTMVYDRNKKDILVFYRKIRPE